jgi:hypothetical protein
MWGFLVLNYLIVVLTLGSAGVGDASHLRLIGAGAVDLRHARRHHHRAAQLRAPRFGEGLLDMFDVTGF